MNEISFFLRIEYLNAEIKSFYSDKRILSSVKILSFPWIFQIYQETQVPSHEIRTISFDVAIKNLADDINPLCQNRRTSKEIV